MSRRSGSFYFRTWQTGETIFRFSMVVDVTNEDAFIMSLAKNIARRGYRPLEILADI